MPSLAEKALRFSKQAKAKAQRHSAHHHHKAQRPKTQLLSLSNIFHKFASNKGCPEPGMPTAPESRPDKSLPLETGEPKTTQVPSKRSTLSRQKREKSEAKSEPSEAGHGSLTAPSSHIEDQHTTAASATKQSSNKTASLSEHTTQHVTVTFAKNSLEEHSKLRKKEFIDKLMDLVVECLDQGLEPLEAPCDGEGCSPHRRGSSSGSTPTPLKRNAAGHKRRCGKSREDGNDSDEGEDRDQGKGVKRAKTDKADESGLKYACPYFKYAPDKFASKRTCCGPGWTEFHRVKEHVKRCHSLPEFQCPRCFEFFKDKNAFVKHQRAAKPCPLKDPKSFPRDLADGFDADQAKRLSERVRGPSLDKWARLYGILFNEEAGNAPSPYHGDDSTDWHDGHTHRSLNQETVDSLREQIPSMFQVWLENQYDHEMQVSGVATRVWSSFVEKVPSVLRCMLDSVLQHTQSVYPDHNTSASGASAYSNSLELLSELQEQFAVSDGYDFSSTASGGTYERYSNPSLFSDETLGNSVPSLDDGLQKFDGCGIPLTLLPEGLNIADLPLTDYNFHYST